MCVDNWVTLLYCRHWHNFVNQQYFDKKKYIEIEIITNTSKRKITYRLNVLNKKIQKKLISNELSSCGAEEYVLLIF